MIVQRQRAKGISSVGLDQKLAMWCEATGTPEVTRLQSHLASLLNAEVEQISSAALERIASQRQTATKVHPQDDQVRVKEFGNAKASECESLDMF